MCDQGRARIEANIRIVEHQGIVGKPHIVVRVGHHENLIRNTDRMGAKGRAAGRLGGGNSDFGFEPLTLLIDERNQRDGHVADFRRESREFVVVRLRRRIEDPEGSKNSYPFRVIGRNRRGRHGDEALITMRGQLRAATLAYVGVPRRGRRKNRAHRVGQGPLGPP